MKRVLQLDGIRGIAILLVLVWHYFTCQIVAEQKSFVGYCCRATSLTWSGVDLFFVLSGFLIAGILLDKRDTSNFFRVFYFRRICRIFPLYYLMWVAFVGLSLTSIGTSPSFRWLFHAPMPLWSYAVFVQNIFMGVRGDLGPHWLNMTWSLAVEEQFYLLVPLLIYFLPRRILLYVLVVAILAAPILRIGLSDTRAFVNTPCRSDSLLSGAALAVLVRWQPFVDTAQRHRHFLLSLLVVMLAGAAVLTLRPQPFGSAFVHLWLAGLYVMLVLIAFLGTERHLVDFLRFPVLVWFGQLSYGIYMFHEAVSGLLYGMLRHGPPEIRTFSDAGITCLALGVTLLLATISHRFFEQPILRLGHRLPYSPKPERQGAPCSVPDLT